MPRQSRFTDQLWITFDRSGCRLWSRGCGTRSRWVRYKRFVPGCYLEHSRAACGNGIEHSVVKVMLSEQGPGLAPFLQYWPLSTVLLEMFLLKALQATTLPPISDVADGVPPAARPLELMLLMKALTCFPSSLLKLLSKGLWWG